MVFSVAQSLNPKFPKFLKLVGAPKTFGNFGFPCVFFYLQQKSNKTHGKFWIFSRNPKNTWKLLDFQQKNKKNTSKLLDFQQKNKKTHGNFWIFSRNPKKHMETFGFSAEIQKKLGKFSTEIQQKTHGNFWIFSRNPKKHLEIQNFQEFLVRPIVFLKFWIF